MKEIKCPKCGNVFKVDDADYALILNQVRNTEFEQEVNRRMTEIENRHKVEQKLAAKEAEQGYMAMLNDKDHTVQEMQAEISRLKGELEHIENKNRSEMDLALAEKDKAIAQFNSTIEQDEVRTKIAIMEEQNRMKKEIEAKNIEIARIKSEAELEKANAQVRETEMKKQHETELNVMQGQIDYYKEMKMKLSTKMVGETLETHCSTLFNTT